MYGNVWVVDVDLLCFFFFSLLASFCKAGGGFVCFDYRIDL